ncbi:MAG TPA: tetraacyldisaccharide 4'-kinase, partial [Rhodocyclaceae bacterium]|nr:tetraacyldisaccharide 4'-kinase [Rhodocyclaceae bacterium]
EPLARLNEVDAVVLNAESWPAVPPAPTFAAPLFRMRLQGAEFYRLGQSEIVCGAVDLAGLRLHAVAGIGAPQRFFAQLSDLGLSFEPHPFPDHHAYGAAELDFIGDALLTTEKDAVKLQALHVSLPVWVLPVAAELTPSLADFVLEKLDGRSSA